MKRYLNSWFVLLLSVGLMICSMPLVAFADVNDLSLASGSNALMTLDLDDSDYAVMPLSSLGTVTNTLSPDSLTVSLSMTNLSTGVAITRNVSCKRVNGRYVLPPNTTPDGYVFTRVTWNLSNALPLPGNYLMSADFSSDFSFDWNPMKIWWVKNHLNAQQDSGVIELKDYINELSGDLFLSGYPLILSNLNVFSVYCNIDKTENLTNIAGNFAFSFVRTSSGGTQIGPDTTAQDYQSGVSSSLSDISSSVDSMTEDLSSAAQNLEYISQSQNLIIQGIDNVILHISDQLYAFWDQLFNLIHLPQMAKMDEIIAAIRKVANDVDMSQVVDTIEDTTAQQIANDNANTSKVEQAVEKHGNFIIDGIKGLFIPSDEYFKSYFDDLYEYFSDRFGFLSFPIDLLGRLIDLFVNNSDVDCILTLPGLEVSGEQVWTEQSFNLTEFMETNFPLVLSSIRMVTSIGLIMAFVSLCETKWNEVMRN